MMKRIFFLLLVWTFSAVSFETLAQTSELLPFFKSFLDRDLTDIKFPSPNQPAASGSIDGSYKRTNRATLLPGVGLRLTEKKEQIGAFFLPNYVFSTKDGLLIEFEYIMMYTSSTDRGITDGICMFLVDATTNAYIGDNLKYGAEGAGFGYTHRSSVSTTILPVSGMKGGYLAVALDQGYFKSWRFDDYEMRNGISYDDGPNEMTNSQPEKYATRRNVTIRGAAGRGLKTIVTKYNTHEIPEGSWGFPMLITRHTGWSIDNGLENENTPGLRNEAGFKLNTLNGMFEQYVTPRIDKPFNIAGGSMFTRSDEGAYRKAIIALEPNLSEGGFNITVTIQHGSEKTVVIEDYTYPSTLTYTENGVPICVAGGQYPSPSPYSKPPTTDLSLVTPQKLVIGFMASTGQITAHTNIIKNLRITPLYGAISEDDTYIHRRGPATVRPLDNDKAYRDGGSKPTASRDNLDPESFRFWEDEEHCVGDRVLEHVTDQGKWVYDPERAEVLFFPIKGFTGEASIMYDVKGKYSPYSAEKYRSSLAKIIINIADNQP